MKNLLTLVLLLGVNFLRAQTPFLLSIEQPELENISDVTEVGEHFYFIQNRATDYAPPYHTSISSDMIVTDQVGNIVEEYNLNGINTHYQRFFKTEDNFLYLLGYMKTDTCQSVLLISKLDLISHELTHVLTHPFCEDTIFYTRVIQGLPQHTFVEVAYDRWPMYKKSIWQLDVSTYTMTPIFSDLYTSEVLSVDFSGKGYIVGSVGLYDFYSYNFDHIKQRNRNEYHSFVFPQFHTPWNEHKMLIHTAETDNDEVDYGEQVRLVDSNLNIVKSTIFHPEHEFNKQIFFPYLNSCDIHQNDIWTAAMYRNSFIITLDGDFHSVTRLNRSLGVVCQHFIGYDTKYLLYGIKALPGGGAIVYGSRLRTGSEHHKGEEIYAIRLGDNCELPQSVSVADQHALTSVSAYPNPGLNTLTFDVQGFESHKLRVELVDATGRVLFEKHDLSEQINVPQFSAGQYFYRILEEDKLIGAGGWVKE